MLIRSTWILTPNETTILPRAYSLELVKQLHEQLGLEIGKEAIPSVSFAGLTGRCLASEGFLTFNLGEFYQLSLCGLEERAGKAIASLNLSDSITFLGANFNIINREDEITSYEELYTTLVANEPEPTRKFNLQFVTPTAFSQQQNHLSLPVPALMFRSWLERWNHFAPIYLGGDELIAYLSGLIKLQKHQLKTRNFQLPRGYLPGCTGQITLQVPHRIDPLLANVAHLLVNYATFAGTGVKTRLGMGKTQINSYQGEP
ncbi:conserved hypothetical protein [Planktothrix sp. PCC 11201]|uniref:CRISPR system precrRNA processing endoribonuclease RAMP protein Cas6 n=1 Tax=Planktothrix sp. PCC 11201 TaxID=1729650 RepID=UPI00091FBEC1|nr:CRISPR system precrRNA processing endoribonuclease RAMP protein Cas6 [Planktothrix sp. PCC 11201]SKB15259.1 conserved hypothetical protein [Planktothrix sp. PCC 11201]